MEFPPRRELKSPAFYDPETVTGLTSFYAAMGAGEYAAVSNDVERLSGRPATSVREYLKAFA